MARILYVEDDAEFRGLFGGRMADTFPEHQFTQASSYREAVEAVERQGPFDGIISDFMYSGAEDDGKPNRFRMGGLDLLHYVTANGIKTPFVFFSSADDYIIAGEVEKKGLKLPADRIIDKMKDDRLFEIIRDELFPKAAAKKTKKRPVAKHERG